jgi:hypothetical protein
MQNTWVRNPPVEQWVETVPSHLRALTATDENAPPQSAYATPEDAQLTGVTGHGMVLVVACTKAHWRSPGSRCMLFLSVRGFSDYAGPNRHSRITWLPCCLPPSRKGVGILIHRLFEAQ